MRINLTASLALLLSLFIGHASAAYTSSGTITFAAASGSTQTNITLAFTGSDARLKTVANGGLVQNTVTRNGIVVPADLVFTDDLTCSTITGSYTWDVEEYSATNGTDYISGPASPWVTTPLATGIYVGYYLPGATGSFSSTWSHANTHNWDSVIAAFLAHYPASFFGGMTTLPLKTFRKTLKQAQKPYREKKLHAMR